MSILPLWGNVTGMSPNGDHLGQALIGADALSLAMAVDAEVEPVDPLLLEDAHPLLLSAILPVKVSNHAPHAQRQPLLREPSRDHTFALDALHGRDVSGFENLWPAWPVQQCLQ